VLPVAEVGIFWRRMPLVPDCEFAFGFGFYQFGEGGGIVFGGEIIYADVVEYQIKYGIFNTFLKKSPDG